MCYKKKYFSFLSMGILMLSLLLVGCSKNEILDQYNNVVQSAGNAALTSDFSLKGNRIIERRLEQCAAGAEGGTGKDNGENGAGSTAGNMV